MEKNFKGYLKSFKNIHECPNCHNEAVVRYGAMKCEHCGKEYLVRRKFIGTLAIVFLFMIIMEFFWNGNYFNGDALINSLVSVGLIIISNLIVTYLMYLFVPGGMFEYEELTDDNEKGTLKE